MLLRLALVTRRFWPLVGGAENVMGHLAAELQQLGVKSTIVTAQWDSHWAREIDHAAVPIVRLPQSTLRGWGTIRYLWSLARWLRAQRHEFDAVIVSTLRYDAYATLRALHGMAIPVVLRAERAGPSGDAAWLRTARFGSRIQAACRKASALIAASGPIAEELNATGFAPDFIELIPNGVPLGEARSAERRRIARDTVAEANSDLKVDEGAPVVLYTGRLEAAKGLHDLLRAWRKIIDVWPNARLWLVGEGPDRDDLYDRLRTHELKYHVAMPGAFDDVSELLHAADVLVMPTHGEGLSLSVLEAMAAGLPVVATDTPGNREAITHGEQGLLVPPRNPTSLAEAIAETLTLREEASRRAERARQHVEQRFSARAMAEKHLALTERLLKRQK
jgi:glycosyltransferase involved in cell wall biosynthesis